MGRDKSTNPRPNSCKFKRPTPTIANQKLIHCEAPATTKGSVKFQATNKSRSVPPANKKNVGSTKPAVFEFNFNPLNEKISKKQLPPHPKSASNKNGHQIDHKKYSLEKEKFQQKKQNQKKTHPYEYFGSSETENQNIALIKKKLVIQSKGNHAERLDFPYGKYQPILQRFKKKANKNTGLTKERKKIQSQDPSANQLFIRNHKFEGNTNPSLKIEKPAKINSIQTNEYEYEYPAYYNKDKAVHINQYHNPESQKGRRHKEKTDNATNKNQNKPIQPQKEKKSSSIQFMKQMQYRWKESQSQNNLLEQRELKINLASECFQKGETDLSAKYSEIILQQIDAINNKTLEDEDALAYVCAFLANAYIFKKDDKYQQMTARALQIYNRRPNMYFQEMITLKNNMALASQNNQKFPQAIVLYNQVLKLEDQYYSLSDERRLSTLNNLFCLYYALKQVNQAKKIYNEVEPILKKLDQSIPIVQLWNKNWKHYSPALKKGK